MIFGRRSAGDGFHLHKSCFHLEERTKKGDICSWEKRRIKKALGFFSISCEKDSLFIAFLILLYTTYFFIVTITL